MIINKGMYTNSHAQSQWLNFALKNPIFLIIVIVLKGTHYSKNYASILYSARGNLVPFQKRANVYFCNDCLSRY